MIAIIGGSSLSQLPGLAITHRQVVRTPYGEPSCALTFGLLAGRTVVFLARHGHGHMHAPHEINYRANLWALKSQQVRHVLAIGSVGGIHLGLVPGALAIPDQLLDYTWGRKHTFFEGPESPVVHVDFTQPYSATLRQCLLDGAQHAGVEALDGGTYACTQGPRLETAAEIARLRRDGADMVGMTGMPEAALARELDMEYACLAVVANYAAGCGDSIGKVDFTAAGAVMGEAMDKVARVLEASLALGAHLGH